MEKTALARHENSGPPDHPEHPVKIRRTIPPTAAPLSLADLLHGLSGIMNRKSILKLESEISEYFGARHVFFVSSGKAALFLILSGLRSLTGRRKVIIPAYTCFSVPSAISMAGLEIVLCDIRPDSLDFDVTELKGLIDDDTLCIIPTHLFGIPSEVGTLHSICRNRRIFIVEDVAQGMGSTHGPQKLGMGGDVAFFSLGRGKNITCGDGGIIITSADDVADSIRKHYSNIGRVPVGEYIRNILEIVFLMIFIHPALYWFPSQLPFLKLGETRFHDDFPVRKLTGFHAGLLNDWRRKLEKYNVRRLRNGGYYRKHLTGYKELSKYSDQCQYLRFPICMKDKDAKDTLCKAGNHLGISPMYPCSANRIEEIKEFFGNSRYPRAERLAETLVALPTHILLKDEDLKAIVEAVAKVPNPSPESQDLLFS
jgi:perosamine synthetase